MDDFERYTTDHDDVPCRGCGTLLTGVTPIGGVGKPKSGMVSVCGYCGEIAIFEVSPLGTFLREATLKEIQDFTDKYPGIVQRVIQHRIEWERRSQ